MADAPSDQPAADHSSAAAAPPSLPGTYSTTPVPIPTIPPPPTAAAPIPDQQQQQQQQQQRGSSTSRAASAHPEPAAGPAPGFTMPSEAAPHGAPVRQYINTKITGVLLEGMKLVAREQPKDPLRVLGEFLLQRSRELEGGQAGGGSNSNSAAP
ncbi:hypothetical protein N656DRAFT_773228 [Canariomyces notabilis]|uniref:Dpy-30 domain-containing protein n=1 Tax=Canariomyces notabilis TaxID=2074819 RepID=A0AAN6TMC8_9PEZI|nr:hypothetical protein N656DRAFT_773228 [Canariomyces arenarius]